MNTKHKRQQVTKVKQEITNADLDTELDTDRSQNMETRRLGQTEDRRELPSYNKEPRTRSKITNSEATRSNIILRGLHTRLKHKPWYKNKKK